MEGELACGALGRRGEVLGLLRNLPQAPVVDQNEGLAFVDAHALMGSGLGWAWVAAAALVADHRRGLGSRDFADYVRTIAPGNK